MTFRMPAAAIALLLVSPGQAVAEAPRRSSLAVLPIESINLSPALTARVQRVLRRLMTQRSQFSLGDPATVARAMDARGPGCGRNISCLRAVGRKLGADLLLHARVGRLGETTVVQLTAFHVAQAVRKGSWEEVLRTTRAEDVDRALARMVARFAPPPAAARPWYRRWWVWTAVAATVAGAVAVTLAATTPSGRVHDGTIVPPGPNGLRER